MDLSYSCDSACCGLIVTSPCEQLIKAIRVKK